MMSRRFSMALFMMIICLLALPCLAITPTLYSQPFDGTGNLYSSQNDTNQYGNFATAYDDFTLGKASTITGVGWTGGYFNGDPSPIAGYTVQFYSNNGGVPGSSVFSEHVLGNANELSLGTAGGFPIYAYSLTLSTPFLASAGTEYWLSVVPDLGFPPQWGWGTSAIGNGGGYQNFFGNGSQLGVNYAFDLNGRVTGTPEPGTFILFGTGLISAIGAVRRRLLL